MVEDKPVELKEYSHTNVDGIVVDRRTSKLVDTKLLAAAMCHNFTNKISGKDCWDLTCQKKGEDGEQINQKVFDAWTKEKATKELNLTEVDYKLINTNKIVAKHYPVIQTPVSIGAFKFSDGTLVYYKTYKGFYAPIKNIPENEDPKIPGVVKTCHKFVTEHAFKMMEDQVPEKKARNMVKVNEGDNDNDYRIFEVVVDITNKKTLSDEEEITMERLKFFGLENSRDDKEMSAVIHAGQNIHFRKGEYSRYMDVVVNQHIGMSSCRHDYSTPEKFVAEFNKAFTTGFITSEEDLCFLLDIGTVVLQGIDINANPIFMTANRAWRLDMTYKHFLKLCLVGGVHYIEGYKVIEKGAHNFKKNHDGTHKYELREEVLLEKNYKDIWGKHLNSALGDKKYFFSQHETKGGEEVTKESQLRMNHLAVMVFAIWKRSMEAFDVQPEWNSKDILMGHPDWNKLVNDNLSNYLSRLRQASYFKNDGGCYTREAIKKTDRTHKSSFGEFWVFFALIPHVCTESLKKQSKKWDGFTEEHFQAILSQEGLWVAHFYDKPTQCKHKTFWKQTENQWVDWNLWVGGTGDRPAQWPPIRPETAPVQNIGPVEEGPPNAAEANP
jgi:hypothetical protein